MGDDVVRFVQPGSVALIVDDFQAGHLDLAAALQQLFAVLRVASRIAGLDAQRQAFDGAPDLDAERAGIELVEGQAAGEFVQRALFGFRADDALGRGQPVPRQQQGAECGA